jgi:hypothetical protein
MNKMQLWDGDEAFKHACAATGTRRAAGARRTAYRLPPSISFPFNICASGKARGYLASLLWTRRNAAALTRRRFYKDMRHPACAWRVPLDVLLWSSLYIFFGVTCLMYSAAASTSL